MSAERSYRPVATALAFFDVAAGGRRPVVFRATSIAVHLAAGFLVFLVLLRLTRKRSLAALTALFFLLHPIQTEAVAGISFIEDPLAALFFFAAFYAHLRSGGAGRRRLWMAAAAVSYLFAVFSKESAGLFPAAALLADWVFKGDGKFSAILRKNWKVYALYTAAASFFLIVRFLIIVNPQHGAAAGYTAGGPARAMAASAAVFLEYVKLFFYPARLSLEHCPGVSAGWSDWRVWVGAAAAAALVSFGIATRGSNAAAAFGALFFVLNFLPVSGIIPFGGLMAERYMYLPSFGLCLFTIGLFMRQNPGSEKSNPVLEKWNVIFSVCFILIYGILAAQRNHVWRDEIYLWQSALKECPASSRVQTNYGRRLLEIAKNPDDSADAERHLEEAVRLDPKNYEAMLALGTAYWRSGQTESALEMYEQAYKEHPSNDVRYNLALILNSSGRQREALIYLTDIMKTQPDWPAAVYLLGNTYLKTDDFENAKAQYLRALSLKPDMSEAMGNLAVVYMKTGEPAKAEALFLRIFKREPNNAYAKRNLEIIRKTRAAPAGK
jgi:Flp pilus assembly protein TadD